ncbi:tetrahydrofolate dehydrogenase/cyclohydrolase catalytic domain-containing protein, partial [Alkalibacillus haloalkaliphilus]|uniref:tetrahydrofolate dehydrogenase/cyclohydrolase catalytic domain-containing protein n=1 Tax=Alkalibacillus haloalkaliphilus TaxID=94136 RepID=UPI000590595A
MKEPLLLDGREVSKSIKGQLKGTIDSLTKEGIVPKLVTILVGDNPSSHTYVQMKANACSKIGMESERIFLPTETTTEELLQTIKQLNEDE